MANEIKELARQTAATCQIRQKVESIQGATAETAEDIKAIFNCA